MGHRALRFELIQHFCNGARICARGEDAAAERMGGTPSLPPTTARRRSSSPYTLRSAAMGEWQSAWTRPPVALDNRAAVCFWVVHRLGDRQRFFVIFSTLNRQHALARGGKHLLEWDGVHVALHQVGPLDAGGCEDKSVKFSPGEFFDSRVDVAADGGDLQVWPQGVELALAAQASRGNPAPGGRLAMVAALSEMRRSRGSVRGRGGDDQLRFIHQRHGDGQILAAMDGQIDLVVEKSLLDFSGEQAFAAFLVEGAVGDLVAGGFDYFE